VFSKQHHTKKQKKKTRNKHLEKINYNNIHGGAKLKKRLQKKQYKPFSYILFLVHLFTIFCDGDDVYLLFTFCFVCMLHDV
jgi:hypothetical protein